MKKLTILVTTMNAVGHVNACAGALTGLLKRGHRVIFVIEEAFKGSLSPLGYEELVYNLDNKPKNVENPGELMTKWMFDAKVIGDYSVWEKMKSCVAVFHSEQSYQDVIAADRVVADAILKYRPDLIYQDSGFLLPSIHKSMIPWIKQASCTPNCYLFNYEQVPPCCSGFPSNGNVETAREFTKLRYEFFQSKKFNDLLESLGYERYENDFIYPPERESMVVYAYPEEFNYPYVKTLDWFNLEVFNKFDDLNEIVELGKLVSRDFLLDALNGRWSGKLVYVSMGSMGSVDLGLMKRLVETLGKTNHKYIVSKGPRHSEYNLASNMYGDRYLPQTSLIPHVDLVITHGGNNTVTESFAQGKPMIALPLFADQFDNAQRLHETGFGVRLDPYKFTESQFINAIDKLLYDDNLSQKLQIASKRILALNRHEELAVKIEQLASNVK